MSAEDDINFSEAISETIRAGNYPLKISENIPKNNISRSIVFENRNIIPCRKEERCILIVDIVGYTQRSEEEQLISYEILNYILNETKERLRKMKLPSKYRNIKLPSKYNKIKGIDNELFKGQGDGGFFILGTLMDPYYIRDALMFAANSMSAIIKYNQKWTPCNIKKFSVRMALTYDTVFVTKDLNGNPDLVGNAINFAQRLATTKEATGNSIFISDKLFHCLQIARELYYENQYNKNPVKSGELSDHVLGCKPDSNNFLYIVPKGIVETKDRSMEAYNIQGRINEINIMPEIK